jgi:hypothetical protein
MWFFERSTTFTLADMSDDPADRIIANIGRRIAEVRRELG